MRFTSLSGEVLDEPLIWASGPVAQSVWCTDASGRAYVVKVGPKAAITKAGGLPYEIEYTSPTIPPAVPRSAVRSAESVMAAAWDYERATDPYLMRTNPLPSPHIAIAPAPDRVAAAEMVLDMDRAHNAALRELAEAQQMRAAVGKDALNTLFEEDHPCGDE